jgi:hypothetical protein
VSAKKPTQKNCDDLLTPIVKKFFPRCLLCNQPTQVAHHHFHKAACSALRYYFGNLINLCNSCHCALHHNESYYASKIIVIRGLKWFKDLEKIKKTVTVKANAKYYAEQYARLKKILASG